MSDKNTTVFYDRETERSIERSDNDVIRSHSNITRIDIRNLLDIASYSMEIIDTIEHRGTIYKYVPYHKIGLTDGGTCEFYIAPDGDIFLFQSNYIGVSIDRNGVLTINNNYDPLL